MTFVTFVKSLRLLPMTFVGDDQPGPVDMSLKVLSSVEEWSLLENGTNVSVITSYPLVNATSLRQDPLYAKNVVFILNLLTMGTLCQQWCGAVQL